MYSIILLAVIGTIVGLIVAPRGWSKLMGLGIGCVIGGFIGAFVGLAIAAAIPRHDVVYGPSTMVSMRTTDGVAGTFVWGTGGISGETSYNFMIKQEDGSITPRSVSASSLVAIIEDDSLTGVGYWRTTFNEPDTASSLYKWGVGLRDYERVVRQEFRVPVGTVVQGFKVR